MEVDKPVEKMDVDDVDPVGKNPIIVSNPSVS